MGIVDVMNLRLIEVAPDTELGAAIERMLDEGVGSVAVCDGARLVGILTERDVLRLVARDAPISKTRVGDVMTTELVTTPADADILDVARSMGKHNIRHIPVVEGDHVLGMVGVREVVDALGRAPLESTRGRSARQRPQSARHAATAFGAARLTLDTDNPATATDSLRVSVCLVHDEHRTRRSVRKPLADASECAEPVELAAAHNGEVGVGADAQKRLQRFAGENLNVGRVDYGAARGSEPDALPVLSDDESKPGPESRLQIRRRVRRALRLPRPVDAANDRTRKQLGSGAALGHQHGAWRMPERKRCHMPKGNARESIVSVGTHDSERRVRSG